MRNTPVFACLLFAACAVDANQRPVLKSRLQYATDFVYRGMNQNPKGGVQTDSELGLHTKDGGMFEFMMFTNIDVSNEWDDGWLNFPGFATAEGGRNGGQLTWVDYKLAYKKTLGDTTYRLGLRNVSFPNEALIDSSFSFGSTNEAFLELSWKWFDWTPMIAVNKDYDSVDGVYAKASISREFGLSEKLIATVDAGIGYADHDQSWWYYDAGFKNARPSDGESGFADLAGSVELAYKYDGNTDLFATVSYSTIVDDDIRDVFDAGSTAIAFNGFDKDIFWLTAGIAWSF